MSDLKSVKEKQAIFDLVNKEVDEIFNKKAEACAELEKTIYAYLLDFLKDDTFEFSILKRKHDNDLFYLTVKKDFSSVSKHSFVIYVDEDRLISANYLPDLNSFHFLFLSIEEALSFAKENKLKVSAQYFLKKSDSLKEKLSAINDIINQIENL